MGIYIEGTDCFSPAFDSDFYFQHFEMQKSILQLVHDRRDGTMSPSQVEALERYITLAKDIKLRAMERQLASKGTYFVKRPHPIDPVICWTFKVDIDKTIARLDANKKGLLEKFKTILQSIKEETLIDLLECREDNKCSSEIKKLLNFFPNLAADLNDTNGILSAFRQLRIALKLAYFRTVIGHPYGCQVLSQIQKIIPNDMRKNVMKLEVLKLIPLLRKMVPSKKCLVGIALRESWSDLLNIIEKVIDNSTKSSEWIKENEAAFKAIDMFIIPNFTGDDKVILSVTDFLNLQSEGGQSTSDEVRKELETKTAQIYQQLACRLSDRINTLDAEDVIA